MNFPLRSASLQRIVISFLAVCAALAAVGVAGGSLLIGRVKHQLYAQQAEAERRQTEAMAGLLADEIRSGRPAAEVVARFQSATGGMTGDGSYLCLLDAQGVLLTHPNPSMVGMSKSAMPARALGGGGAETYGSLVAAGRPAAALLVGPDASPEELVYVRRVPGSPWTLAAHENARVIEQRFRELGWQLSAIAGPTVLAMALVGTVLARALGRSYERRIEAANAQLERRVEERTAALSEALSELRAAHERLVQGEKMHLLGELMAGIAHEIRNPLTVVAGYAGLLAQGDYPPAVRRFGAQIDAGAQRAHRIVANLLAFARRQPPSRRPVSPIELLEQSIELIAADLRRAGVTLRTDLPAACAPLCLDAQQMEQVFLNLLNNARQALEEHAGERTVTVTLREDAETVTVRIADSGPGLGETVRAQLFRPFVTTKETGTGLGLSLCRRFVEAHGGTIVAPTVPRGAVFAVTLPRTATAGACALPELPAMLSPVPALSRG